MLVLKRLWVLDLGVSSGIECRSSIRTGGKTNSPFKCLLIRYRLYLAISDDEDVGSGKGGGLYFEADLFRAGGSIAGVCVAGACCGSNG